MMKQADSQPMVKTDQTSLITSYLADQDVPCPVCHYNLRSNRSDCCPECGQELQLELRLAKPIHIPFIAGMIPLAAIVGFNAIFLAIILIIGVTEDDYEEVLFGGITLGSILVPSILLLWCWIRFRVRLLARSRVARSIWVSLCWAWMVGAVVLVWVIAEYF